MRQFLKHPLLSQLLKPKDSQQPNSCNMIVDANNLDELDL